MSDGSVRLGPSADILSLTSTLWLSGTATNTLPRDGDRRRPHRRAHLAAEYLVLTAHLPKYEPRAMPDTPAEMPSALVDGRHRLVHVKVLAFRDEAGGTNV